MVQDSLVVVAVARTPFCEYSGTPGFGLLKEVSALDLGAQAARAALERAQVKPEWIGHVVMGNAMQTSSDALYGARHVGLKAGLPKETPALTVNRICGSGIQSVVNAAHLLLLNEADFVLAGGMENMSQAPFVLRGAREGFRLGSTPALEDSLWAALLDPYCGFSMGQTAENCAKRFDISRQAQDEFALRSHQLGSKSIQEGLFKKVLSEVGYSEVVPIKIKRKREEIEVWDDDHVKPGTTLETLSKLPPAFGKDGTVTAGNASGIVDGAACIVVTRKEKALEKKLPVLGKITAWHVAGVEPEIMGIGPVPAIQGILKKTVLRLEEIDLFEINEAFAGQYLAVEKQLALDRSRVNVNGGAISLGHPLGATGTRLILTLLLTLRRLKKKRGIASACIGGGQGIAMLVETV